jgi:hypothetical protein
MAMLETANKSSGKSGANLAKHTRVLPADNVNGYEAYEAGSFTFQRDEYFARISWPGGSHVMAIDYFLRALMRDVAWNFFYGTVNFDGVIGTTNYYGEVMLYAGLYNDAYRKAGREFSERFSSDTLMGVFKAMIRNWTNEGYDPFAAPLETGVPWGRKHGNNDDAVDRLRVTAKRMVGLPGDTPLRTDESGYPVNRGFDEIVWDVKDKASGKNRARVIMKAGDVSCMPADIRHTGYADKRSMLLVWENASPKIPELIQSGKAPVVSVSF